MAIRDITTLREVTPAEFKDSTLLPDILTAQISAVESDELDDSLLSPAHRALKAEQRANNKINVWVAYANQTQEILQEYAGDLLDKLSTNAIITDTSATEAYQVAQMFSTLGFNLPQDVLAEVAVSNLQPLFPVLARYVETSSTTQWAEFLSVILAGKVKIEELYTKDYINFSPTPQGTLLQQGGDWFKSTHLNVKVSYLGRNDIGTNLTGFNVQKGRQVLEEYLPINLVINKFGFYLVVTIEVGIIVKALKPRKIRYKAHVGPADVNLDKVRI